MMRNQCVLFLSLVAVGCATTYQPPVEVPIQKSATIAAPIEKVWQATIGYFGANNIPIDNMDRNSYFIKTKPVSLASSFASRTMPVETVPLRNDWCDCGNVELSNVWGSTHGISVAFNIVLIGSGETTTATTNVFFEGVELGQRNLYASGYDVSVPLKCVSTGKLEKEIQDYLKTHSRSG